MEYPKVFKEVINHFTLLPGIGNKGAERMVYKLLELDQESLVAFGKALIDLKDSIKYCQVCGQLSDQDICPICQDNDRDQKTICIVESPKDVFAMEKIKEYKGTYHVLHGTISMMDGKTIDDLNIASLMKRLNDPVDEIIIATNPTREGETTALFLAKFLSKYNVKVSRIANGLPIGSQLDYADEMTILKSLEGRKDMY